MPGLLNQVWEQDLPKNGADIKKLKALPTIKIMFRDGKKRNEQQSGIPAYDASQTTAQIQTGGQHDRGQNRRNSLVSQR